MSETTDAAGNLTSALTESVVSTLASFIPMIMMVTLLAIAMGSIFNSQRSEGGGLLDHLLAWASNLGDGEETPDDAPPWSEEWRPYLAAGGVVLVAVGLFGLLLMSPAI